jgi:hypothetical protein
MLLKPPPGTESISTRSRRYAASADGLIHNVDERDLAELRAAGCEPATPTPPTAQPAQVRLKGRPHMVYAPESGSLVRYTADADGVLHAAPEHEKALLLAGCARA